MTDNGIGVEGAKVMCETLKVNPTLTGISLSGEEERKEKEKENKSG